MHTSLVLSPCTVLGALGPGERLGWAVCSSESRQHECSCSAPEGRSPRSQLRRAHLQASLPAASGSHVGLRPIWSAAAAALQFISLSAWQYFTLGPRLVKASMWKKAVSPCGHRRPCRAHRDRLSSMAVSVRTKMETEAPGPQGGCPGRLACTCKGVGLLLQSRRTPLLPIQAHLKDKAREEVAHIACLVQCYL
ncbi:Homeodomain Transcription Factor 2-Like [Manis pentadactyla]|nr:Homeodomain Transcription Factor 2-Like [Manis pentadactyla]